MRIDGKTGFVRALCLVTLLSMGALVAFGASTGGLADDWTKPSGDQFGGVSFSSAPGGAITMIFPSRGAPPMPCVGTVVAEPGGLNGPFGGNYISAEVKSLRFLVESDGHTPGYAMVVFRSSASGRSWRNRTVMISEQAGVVVTNIISFQRSAGWDTDHTGNLDSMWDADLQNVDMIGITISQKGLAAQSYTISQFQLQDVDGAITPPAVLTPLEQALKDRFGVSSVNELTEEQKLVDLDNDGMADVDEIRSELEGGYADKIFTAQIGDVTGEGVLVKWACVKNGTYTLYRADSLASPFLPVDAAIEVSADSTGFMTHLDTTVEGDGPYFYKVHRILF